MNKKNQKGAVLIEWVIILPILIMLMFATFEIAKAVSEYKTIVSQVRNAGRYLTTVAPGQGRAEAACMVKTGEISTSCGTNFILPGFADYGFYVDIEDAGNRVSTHRAQNTSVLTGGIATSINLVTVTAKGYRYKLTFGGILSGIFYNNIEVEFGPIAVTMRQAN